MQRLTDESFGLLIAYVLPGFVILWGGRYHSATIDGWLGAGLAPQPSVSGFLFVFLSSVGIGLFASTVRWLTVDNLHHWTGIKRRTWAYCDLQEHIRAVEFLVANQYRYYQFYGNTFVSLVFAFPAYAAATGNFHLGGLAAFLVIELVLWLGSRDTLRNYHHRVGELLQDNNTQIDVADTDPTS